MGKTSNNVVQPLLSQVHSPLKIEPEVHIPEIVKALRNLTNILESVIDGSRGATIEAVIRTILGNQAPVMSTDMLVLSRGIRVYTGMSTDDIPTSIVLDQSLPVLSITVTGGQSGNTLKRVLSDIQNTLKCCYSGGEIVLFRNEAEKLKEHIRLYQLLFEATQVDSYHEFVSTYAVILPRLIWISEGQKQLTIDDTVQVLSIVGSPPQSEHRKPYIVVNEGGKANTSWGTETNFPILDWAE